MHGHHPWTALHWSLQRTPLMVHSAKQFGASTDTTVDKAARRSQTRHFWASVMHNAQWPCPMQPRGCARPTRAPCAAAGNMNQIFPEALQHLKPLKPPPHAAAGVRTPRAGAGATRTGPTCRPRRALPRWPGRCASPPPSTHPAPAPSAGMQVSSCTATRAQLLLQGAAECTTQVAHMLSEETSSLYQSFLATLAVTHDTVSNEWSVVC